VKTLELTEATGTLAEYSTASGRDPLVVVRHGKPIAALIALPDDVDLALLERSRESIRREGGISSAEMRRRVEEMNRTE
jgi:antitoxin (DNA-binding transcriptional repressor) of toxin-antitoxin stability system